MFEYLSSRRNKCQIEGGPCKNKFSWTIENTLQLSFSQDQSELVNLMNLFLRKIVTTFLKCGILFKNGQAYILVIPSNSFHRETCDTFEHKCFTVEEGLGKTLETDRNFLIYLKSEYEFLVFTNGSKNDELFRRIDYTIISSRKLILTIKFEDVIKTPKGDEKRNEKGKQDFSLIRRKLGTKRQKAIPPSLYDVYKVEAFPISRNNYPIQVSDEQNLPESSEFAFSGNPREFHFNESTASSRHSPLSSGQESLGLDDAPSLNEHSTISQPARYPDYISLSERLNSFSTWTTEHQNPRNLSRAGFFFTGSLDLVRCFQCGIGLKDFCSDVVPTIEHARYSPECPFLRDILGDDRLAEIRRNLNATDVNYYRQWNGRGNNANQRSYRHPDYQTIEARLASFATWPPTMTQTPSQLAGAGLFYTGYEDQVRCFACDGGLRRWDVGDDPWTEHCRWFPNCPYAIEVRGEDFIALIQASTNTDGADSGDDILTAVEQLAISDPIAQASLNEYKSNCLEMGYEESDFDATVQELTNRGSSKPSLDEILDLIDIIKMNRKEQAPRFENETPSDLNLRLKSIVICQQCHENEINTLFLPCGHHKLCMSCANSLEKCPVCGRQIREKIRTYMA